MTVIANLGQRWRGTVTPWGDVEVQGDRPLQWFVAADDRWHRPAEEPTVRQRRIDGTPVVETKLRIPGGDAVQTAWCTADSGGMTFVEVRNDSPLPIAVAFSRGDLWLPRQKPNVPIQGIDLPEDSVVLPVGHASTVVVGLSHKNGHLPPHGGTPPRFESVVSGWLALCERASRLSVPDVAALDAVTMARCDAAIDPTGPDVDGEGLVRAGEMARMGLTDLVDPVSIAAGVERLLRSRRTEWETRVALRGARLALVALDETRAVSDLRRATAGRSWDASPPERPVGIMAVPWMEHQLVSDDAQLLPGGFPPAWLGAPIEAHGIAVDGARVSFAVRWHGARPGVLWEVAGPAITLTAPSAAPGWSSTEPKGEALWPAPPAP